MSDAGGAPVVHDAANEAADARAKQLVEDLQKAKEAGWNNPIPFNYETVTGGEANADAPHPADASWLSDAAVYEWQDDFGTVAPRNEELERQLFEDPDMQRAGNMIQALEFDVTTEGEEKVHPVRSVSVHELSPYLATYVLISHLVRRGRPSSCHVGERQALPLPCPDAHPVVLYPCSADWPRCRRHCPDRYDRLHPDHVP